MAQIITVRRIHFHDKKKVGITLNMSAELSVIIHFINICSVK